MKRFFLLGVAFALAFSPTIASATILFPTGGGTGSSTLSGILIGNGVAPVNSLLIGTGLTLTGTTLAATGGSSSTFGTTSISATSPLIWNTSTANLSIQQASGSQNGFLSSTDWTTFNNKQPAGNYITALTGDISASGAGSVAATLATVNSNVGTFTYPSVTVNGKGLVTAISNGTAPTIYTATFPITLTGSAFGSAFSTTSNSGMAQGFQYVGSGGIFQTAASSSLFGFTPQPAGTYVTSVAGTANQISSSGSTAITLSLPNHVIFPIDYVASAGSTTNATSTNFAITGGASNCNGTSALTTNSSGVVGCTAQPQGTVTAASIASANGFAGSSSGGATPIFTISTSITSNVLKGNGTAIVGAVNGTDFTLLTANTCGAGQFFNSATAAGVLGCGTPAGTTYTGTFPIAVTGSVISFGGLSTSSPLVSGQPTYATGVNTIASVASSTFLTSIGGQASGNYLTALTGDGTASGPGSAAFTLATVNSNLGTFNNLTVNAKGLVTAASNIAYDTFGYLFPNNATTSSLTFGGVTITGAGTGCAQFTSGVLSSTGTACGSGGGGSGVGTVSTSSLEIAGQLPYWTSTSGYPATLGGIATSSLAVTAPITFSGTLGSQIGGIGGNFGCTTASAGVTGCLSGTDWSTFNNKQASISTTWPLILSGTTLSFGGLSTTSPLTQGAVPYVTGVNTFGQIATTSVTNGTGISFTGTAGALLGGSALTITNSGVTSNVAGTGISVSGATGAVTVTNTGVTSIVAGTNVTISGSTGAVTVNSTATGGAAYPFFPSTDGGINTSATTTPIEGAPNGLSLDVPVTGWFGIGGNLLAYASSTNKDTVFGIGAGGQNATTSATSNKNVAIGFDALNSMNAGGSQNVAIGYFANLALTSASDNTSVGFEAGQNSNALQNTAMGFQALNMDTGGSDNTSIGGDSGQCGGVSCSIADSVFLGFFTGNNATGNFNTLIGYSAGSNLTTGKDNIILGAASTTSANITTGSQNVIIGDNISAPSISNNAQLDIQNIIFGTGNGKIGSGVSTGQIGIATTTPWRTFSVSGTVGFANLTSSGSSQTDNLCLSSTNEVISDTAACLVSAKRFKENINALNTDNSLTEVMQLVPVSFNYKPDFNGALQSNPNYSTQQVGFIADAVQKIDPRLVTVETATTTFEGKIYGPGVVQSVRYENMTALLAGAIQAQQKEIDALKPAAKTAEDNWQWAAIALLVCWNIALTVRRKK